VKRGLLEPNPAGTGMAISEAMVVSWGVMLTCPTAGSLPVLIDQRSTPHDPVLTSCVSPGRFRSAAGAQAVERTTAHSSQRLDTFIAASSGWRLQKQFRCSANASLEHIS
jgi:hypothetical protein